jgi:tetratricopeptide (TPR) repeat protein
MASSATVILWILVVVFLIGVVLLSIPTGNKVQSAPPTFSGKSGVAATVNGQKIKADVLNKLYAEQTKSGENLNVDTVTRIREGIFNAVLQKELSKQAMDSLRLGGWGLDGKLREIASEYAQKELLTVKKSAADKFKKQQDDAKKVTKDAKKADEAKPKTEAEFLAAEMEDYAKQAAGSKPGLAKLTKPTEEQFTRWIVNDFLMSKTGYYEEFKPFAERLLIGKTVMQKLQPSPTSDEMVKRMQTEERAASFIFIPAEHSTPQDLEKAKTKATDIYNRVKAKPATFGEEANKNSADPSAQEGGNLHWVTAGRNNLPIIAEYQIFATEMKQNLSPVVLMSEPDYGGGNPRSGYGFVRVDKVRPLKDSPYKDSDADAKLMARLDVSQRYATSLGSSYVASLRTNAKIEVFTPELRAYYHSAMGDSVQADKDREEAMNDAQVPELVKAAFAYYLSMRTPDITKRAKYLEQAIPYNGTGATIANMHQQLGDCYKELKRKDEAIKQYQYAADSADPNNTALREQVLKALKELGAKKEAAELADWMKKNVKPASPVMPGSPIPMR